MLTNDLPSEQVKGIKVHVKRMNCRRLDMPNTTVVAWKRFQIKLDDNWGSRMPDQVTLDDVARVCGVSRATASRALNGRAGVRDDVRDRIRRIADSMGFVPNRAAQQLASGRSSVIGLVIPSADLHIDPYGASITHAVGRAAHQVDQGLMLHLATNEPGVTVHHIMRDGLVDGLLVSSVAVGVPWIDELLAQDGLPTVLVGTHPWIPNFDAVDVENLESSAAAVEHLFQQGCTRVATITGLLDRADAMLRLDGYRLAHQRRGLAVDEDLIYVCLLYTSPSPRDRQKSRMPSSA